MFSILPCSPCSPYSPCSPNFLYVLPSEMAGWNNLWSPVLNIVTIASASRSFLQKWGMSSEKGFKLTLRLGSKAYAQMYTAVFLYIYIIFLSQPSIFCLHGRHCQRHNGPEGWVHITSSWSNFILWISTKQQLQHLNHTSASRLTLKFKILTKPNLENSNKIQLHNFYKTSAVK